MNKPIIVTKTGGFSLLSILLLVAGVFLLVLQGVTLATPADPEGAALLRFLPGGLGALLLVFFALGIRNGTVEIFPDRVAGKTAGGKRYEVKWEEIGELSPSGRNFWLRGSDNKVLVADKMPRYRKALGLVWLLKNYPALTTLEWSFYELRLDPPQSRPVRYFDDQGKAVFGDRGFLFRFAERVYYFPVSQTSPLPPQPGEEQTPPTLAASVQPIPRFEPDPTYLPLESVWQTVSTSDWAEGEKIKLLEEWIEHHGGCSLEAAEEGIDAEFTGQVGDYKVRVSRPRRAEKKG